VSRRRQPITPERIAVLRAMPYRDYLKTQEWIRRRAVELKIVAYRCQVCNGGEDLQVHHRSYENLGCEKRVDLIVLCKHCHALFHERRALVKEGKTLVTD
jgi:5-methylcytosine-specific restriction endonuclease McrA